MRFSTEKYSRATTDIDLLAERTGQGKEHFKIIFQEILSLNFDDGIVFDPSSIQVSDIAEFKDYPGVRITALAYLERTQISITIDIGFGDQIVPANKN